MVGLRTSFSKQREQIIHETQNVNRRDRRENARKDAEKNENLEEKEKAVILVML